MESCSPAKPNSDDFNGEGCFFEISSKIVMRNRENELCTREG